MKTLLRPYEGTLPYLFVSYAHKNDAAVLEIISTLQSRGFRVWYDEGIEAGSEWPESIASHLERAQLVLAFLSPAYLRSDNCRKEMHYALTKKKPVINVYLEPTELSPGMEMQIGNLFALMKYTYPSEEYFYDKLFSAELLDAGKFAGEPAGELTVADLKGLTALYVCGDRYWFAAPQQGVDAAAAGVETAEMIDPSGQTVTVRRGDIRDLSDLAYFPSLTAVLVQFQSLTSLESLPACGVEVFDVSANRLTSLSGIEQLPKLTALTADGNAVTDLTGLGRCLNVRKLSLNGANVSDLSELRALTKLQDVTLSHCTRRELLIVLHKSSLTHLTLVGCDLRGDFFRSFDRERALTSLSLTDCELDSTSGLEDFTGLTELTVRGVSGTFDWSALGGLPLQTVTADALQADAIAAATTVAVTVVD